MSGWIKFYRQFMENGHFHMPDRALKIFLFVLLKVSHRNQERWNIERGAGWFSLDMIADECSEIDCDGHIRRMSRKSIIHTLNWLEQNGYIKRTVIKGKGQKISVPNYDVYQAIEAESSESEHPPELPVEPPVEHPPEPIQELKELKEPKNGKPGSGEGPGSIEKQADLAVKTYEEVSPPPSGKAGIGWRVERRKQCLAALRAGCPVDVLLSTIREVAASGTRPLEVRELACRRAGIGVRAETGRLSAIELAAMATK